MIRALLLCPVLLLVCSPATAQSPAPAEPAVRALCPGPRIRVLVQTRTVEGYCGFVDSVAVPLRLGTTERLVPLSEVDAVWVDTPDTGRGAVIGGAVGFGIGAAAGLLLVSGLCDSTTGCVGDNVRVGLMGGVVVGAGGALVGALLGSTSRTWSRRFP